MDPAPPRRRHPTLAGLWPEEQLLKRVRAFAHVDDPHRATAYDRLLADDAPIYDELSPGSSASPACLLLALVGRRRFHVVRATGSTRFDASWPRAPRSVSRRLRFDAARHLPLALSGSLAEVPLRVHARYQREEILAALDFPRKPNSFREGVFTPRPQRRRLLHHPEEVRGGLLPHHDVRRLPDQPRPVPLGVAVHDVGRLADRSALPHRASTVLLFVRQEPKDDLGTSPYLFLGPATYVSHTGERPIAITWKLEHPMPVEFLQQASAIAQ